VPTTGEASKHEWEDSCEVHEVWSWNLQQEFGALVAAVAAEAEVVLGIDTEFPGLLWKPPEDRGLDAQMHLEAKYRVLVKNIDSVWPIQVGIAVARGGGTFNSVWNFHLAFDISADLHTKAAVSLLRTAGVDFERHATEGIDPRLMGSLLSRSPLFGWHENAPLWVTFSGEYDLGFLIKLLVAGSPLPQDPAMFEEVLSYYFPRRHELRVAIPRGSLDIVANRFSVVRCGTPHTAGSDALLTLEVYQSELYQNLLLQFSEEARYAAGLWGSWCEEGWGASSWDASSVWGFNNWSSFEEVETSPIVWPDSYPESKAVAEVRRKIAYQSFDASKEVSSQATSTTTSSTDPATGSAAEAAIGDADDDDDVDAAGSSFSGLSGTVGEEILCQDGEMKSQDGDAVVERECPKTAEEARETESSDVQLADASHIRSRSSFSAVASWKPSSLKASLWKASSERGGRSLIYNTLVSFESFYVVAVFVFSLLLLVLFPPCLSSLILLPLHMVLLMLVRSWASPSPQPSLLISAYLVGCCIRLGAAIAAAGTRLWVSADG
jgi:CCR4-NOT transcription complex subunit 7/8